MKDYGDLGSLTLSKLSIDFDNNAKDAKNFSLIMLIILFLLIILVIAVICYKQWADKKQAILENKNDFHLDVMDVDVILAKFSKLNSLNKNSKELCRGICLLCLDNCKRVNDNQKHGEHKDISDLLSDNDIQIPDHQPPTMLICGHFFHYDCIQSWFNDVEKSCPACKYHADNITDEEIPMVPHRYNFLNAALNIHNRINKQLGDRNVVITKDGLAWENDGKYDQENLLNNEGKDE